MVIVHSIVVFDVSSIIAMLVIASLSKSIGEALKIIPYYKVLYITASLVLIAAAADTIPLGAHGAGSKTFFLALRCIAGLIALPVCLRYWKWLIAEYFKK